MPSLLCGPSSLHLNEASGRLEAKLKETVDPTIAGPVWMTVSGGRAWKVPVADQLRPTLFSSLARTRQYRVESVTTSVIGAPKEGSSSTWMRYSRAPSAPDQRKEGSPVTPPPGLGAISDGGTERLPNGCGLLSSGSVETLSS